MSTEKTEKPAFVPNMGRKLLRDTDGIGGTITAREDDRYIIEWADGSTGFVLAASLDAADADHQRSLTSKPTASAARPGPSSRVDEVIADYQSKAASGYAKLNAMRGLDPRSKTFSQDVTNLLKSGSVKLPEPKVEPMTDSKVASLSKHVEAVSNSRGKKAGGGVKIVTSITHTGKQRD